MHRHAWIPIVLTLGCGDDGSAEGGSTATDWGSSWFWAQQFFCEGTTEGGYIGVQANGIVRRGNVAVAALLVAGVRGSSVCMLCASSMRIAPAGET